jgi:ribosomal protein S18 acetylase RimI-like enzyme
MMNSSLFHLQSDALLDNPIWHSLVTRHSHFALGEHTGNGLARRYPSDIGPLSGLQEATAEAYMDLAAMVPSGDIVVLFLEEEPEVPNRWELLRGGTLVQMICPMMPSPVDSEIVPLEPSDTAEMVALADLTEPGPFRHGTSRLGGFLGIRVNGRLAAMAGQRLSPAGFSEISAVCTHPDFRGRGYARALVAEVARNICLEGRMPFLTSFEANTGAIRIYQQVGFILRRTFQLAVLKPPSK